jgi:SAM-dependent methyltransferase
MSMINEAAAVARVGAKQQCPTRFKCQVCGTETGALIESREMMYELRHPFAYAECDGCGGLQLLDQPDDMSLYYPRDYYSYSVPRDYSAQPRSGVRRWLCRYRNAGAVFGNDLFSWLLNRLAPSPNVSAFRRHFALASVRSFRARILDVGCGNGELLQDLAHVGFSSLVGVDPFAIDRRTEGLQIHAVDISRFRGGPFDLIMCHHALEHMPDQIGALTQMGDLLADEGTCLIRIPIASSEVRRQYAENWVELDPPRHLFIHSRRSFELAASAAGLKVIRAEWDETAFGYWVSELYQRDISFIDPATHRWRDVRAYFTNEQLDEFEQRAQAANMRQDGGRAAFYLQKSSASTSARKP